jgi:hypothetical protein
MANRKATFAKRQRETDLKDRAKQKDDRRNQKRGEVRDVKGPAIAWDEAVYAVTTPDDPPIAVDPDAVVPEERPDGPTRPGDAPARSGDGPARAAAPAAAPAPAAPAAAPVTPAPSAPAVKSAAAPAISGAASPGKPAASAAAPASPRRVG